MLVVERGFAKSRQPKIIVVCMQCRARKESPIRPGNKVAVSRVTNAVAKVSQHRWCEGGTALTSFGGTARGGWRNDSVRETQPYDRLISTSRLLWMHRVAPHNFVRRAISTSPSQTATMTSPNMRCDGRRADGIFVGEIQEAQPPSALAAGLACR